MRSSYLFRMLYLGYQMVLSRREQLDAMNVFPIPDGDTGKNLTDTLRNVVDYVKASNPTNYEAFSQAVKHGAVTGGRGNSGIIFSAWLMNVVEKIVCGATYAEALRCGSDEAKKVVENPKPGTILTLMDDLATSVEKDGYTNIVQSAYLSVDGTSELLPVLKRHGVVDTGALGLALFIEGVMKVWNGDNDLSSVYKRFDDFTPKVTIEEHAHSDDIQYQFCTQLIFCSEEFDRKKASRFLTAKGDDVRIIGAEETHNVHVHTNEPEEVIWYFITTGSLKQCVVNDMREQSVTREHLLKNKSSILLPENNVGNTIIITDATADLPKIEAEKHGVVVVGMEVEVSNTRFMYMSDWTPEMTSERFYELLGEEGAEGFTTVAISPHSWIEAAEPYLETGKNVIYIPFAGALSSTFNNAQIAVEELKKRFPEQNIACVDSRTTSTGLSYLIRKTRENLLNGAEFKETITELEKMRSKIRLFVAIDDIQFLLHGGRMTEKEFNMANLFNRRPAITLDLSGNAIPIKYVANPKSIISVGLSQIFRGTFPKRGTFKAITNMAMGALNDYESFADNLISIVYTGNRDTAEQFASYLNRRFSRHSFPITVVNPILGGHIGPGNLGLFMFCEGKK